MNLAEPLRQRARTAPDHPAIRYERSAASTMPEQVSRRWTERFGRRMFEGYRPQETAEALRDGWPGFKVWPGGHGTLNTFRSVRVGLILGEYRNDSKQVKAATPARRRGSAAQRRSR